MDALNTDMLMAVKKLNLDKQDEDIVIEILYNERVHKNEEWSTDAVRSFKAKIDDLADKGDLQ